MSRMVEVLTQLLEREVQVQVRRVRQQVEKAGESEEREAALLGVQARKVRTWSLHRD